MKTEHLYKAKDVSENKWVYGNYVNQVYGCVPLIITHAWMQDNGEVDFDYCFVDKDTVEEANIYKPNYYLEPTYIFNTRKIEDYNEVAHCPRCNKILDEFEKPNFCSDCGLALDWR